MFDLDGVLIDSEPVWEDVRRTFVAERGGRLPADAQQRMMGMNTREWSTYLSEQSGVGLSPAELATEVIDRMAARYAGHLPLLPGAVEAVRTTAERWPLGLASSSPARLIETVLATAGIADLFRATLSSEEVAHGKPAPDVYLEVTRRLGLDPTRCAAIEDSTNGLLAAAAAGLRVIAVPRPSFPPSPEALATAHAVLADLTHLTPATVA